MRRSLVSPACLACSLLAALLLGPPLRAEDELTGPGSALLELARAKAGGGEHEEAGALVGQAVAAAVKAKDLAAEQQCAEVLEELLDEVEEDARPDALSDAARNPRPKRWNAREVVAEVLARLDAKRRGVFVSAHALAADMVLDSIAIGDATHLDAVRAALAAAAKQPKCGVGVALFARLSDAVGLARTGRNAEALGALTGVGGELEGYGFVVPALHARLEEAAVLHATSRTPEAFGVLVRAIDAVQDGEGMPLPSAREWLHAVEERMRTAPPEAWTAFREKSQRFMASSPGAPGGKGGSGASGGATPLARALAKTAAGKPLATARRSAAGFDVDLAFDDEGPLPAAAFQGQIAWGDDGFTLLLAGTALAVAQLDATGRQGQPGGRGRPSRARAFTWLAPGETWILTPGGIDVTGKPTPVAARTGR